MTVTLVPTAIIPNLSSLVHPPHLSYHSASPNKRLRIFWAHSNSKEGYSVTRENLHKQNYRSTGTIYIHLLIYHPTTTKRASCCHIPTQTQYLSYKASTTLRPKIAASIDEAIPAITVVAAALLRLLDAVQDFTLDGLDSGKLCSLLDFQCIL